MEPIKDKLREFEEAVEALQNNADMVSNNIRMVEHKLYELKLHLKFEAEINSTAIISWELYEPQDKYRLMLSYKDKNNNIFKKPFIAHSLDKRREFVDSLPFFVKSFTQKMGKL